MRSKKPKKMTKFGYVFCWKIFAILVLLAVHYHIYRISSRVIYKQKQYYRPSDNITIGIDICYNLHLDRETCKETVDRTNCSKSELINCEFEKPIHCYTKDFKKKTPKEIIDKFKECNLQNLTYVESESNSTKKLERNDYELFSGHICAKYYFAVDSEQELTKLKIWPKIENKQTFNILIYTTRAYKNQTIHTSLKSNLMRRFCWSKHKTNNQEDGNQTNQAKKIYRCPEDEKEYLFELTYFSLKNLESPMDSNCVYRNGSTQHECYENCIKEHNKYYLLTYNESALDFVMNFDKKSASEYINQCLDYCKQPDCISGTFQIPVLIERDSFSKNFIHATIKNIDYPTDARPFRTYSEILFMFIIFTCLFMGLNFYGGLIKTTNLYKLPFKKSKKHKKITIKGIFTLLVLVGGISIGIFFEKKLFNFGKEKKMLSTRLDGIKERNLSVSICYELCSILKKENRLVKKENCSDELLMGFSLDEINNITYQMADFKKKSSMKNTVRIVPIRQAEFPIVEFFREFKKCFRIDYEGRNLYPSISLQRKSHLHFNSSSEDGTFAYFYIEDGFRLPQIDAPKNKTSFLHTIETIDYRGRKNCIDYNKTYECGSKDNCLQECALKLYFEKRNLIPIYVNVKVTEKYRNSTFENNREVFDQILQECKTYYEKKECFSTTTSLRSKYINTDPHDISITLTPKMMHTYAVKDESILLVINRIISFFIIFTGLSVKDIVKDVVNAYFYSLASLYNLQFQFVSRIAYLIVFLLFLVHLSLLIHSIIHAPMVDNSYKYLVKKIVLPKVRICYELEQRLDNLNDNRINKMLLDQVTLNISRILENITFFDSEFKKRTLNVTDLENNEFVRAYSKYKTMFKCIKSFCILIYLFFSI